MTAPSLCEVWPVQQPPNADVVTFYVYCDACGRCLADPGDPCVNNPTPQRFSSRDTAERIADQHAAAHRRDRAATATTTEGT